MRSPAEKAQILGLFGALSLLISFVMSLRNLFFISVALFGLTACGQDPSSVCVFDADEYAGQAANAAAFSESDCSSGGEYDAFEQGRINPAGRLSEEEAARLKNFR